MQDRPSAGVMQQEPGSDHKDAICVHHSPRAGQPPSGGDGDNLSACLTWLRDPATYPDRPTVVIPIETSRSWVFLTDRFAYKLKKPIRHPLVDLSTLGAREANVKAEVRLNRRLAPDIYLEIIALTQSPSGQLMIGGHGRVVDWLVKMRRLPDRLMLDSLLDRQALPQVRLRVLANRLARFYVGAHQVRLSGITYRQRLLAELMLNYRILTDAEPMLPLERVKILHARLLSFLQENEGLLDARAEGGYLVEGHGDLRPEHVCLREHPVVFDCLEFSERLRQVDPLDDLAFLTVGCERLDSPEVGKLLYDTYRSVSADAAPNRLVEFYCSYRAGLRARLAAAHLPGLAPQARGVWKDKALSFLRVAEHHASALT
jgi:aminoglycoside phosphotransferase family enzyme